MSEQEKTTMQERLDIAGNQMLRANQAYLTLEEISDMNKSYLETMKVAESFFSLTARCLVSELLFSICKMYDTNENAKKGNEVDGSYVLYQDVKNVVSLLGETQYDFVWCTDLDDKSIFSKGLISANEIIQQIDSERVEMSPAIKNISKLRNKLYAHNDAKVFLSRERFFEQYGVTYAEIKSLLILNINIINFISVVLENNFYNPVLGQLGSLKSLVKYADFGRMQISQQTEEVTP